MATVDRSTWELPPIFKLVAELGNVPLADLERTLNLGVGMVAIVDAAGADAASPGWTDAAFRPGSWAPLAPGRRFGQAGPDYVQGAKGVDGGAVRLVGNYAY